MDRQLVGRLGIAVIAIAAVTAGIFILGDHGSPPPSPPVAVVGEPSPSSVPPRTIMATATYTSTPPAPSGYQVTYELAGTGTATVVYDSNGLGLVHQELDVALPWRKELSWPSAGSVQLLGQGSGAVECRVSVGGRVVTTHKAAPGEVAACVS
ncbi:hypothetical protein Amsp01_072530 [Amycolatopsis sp. NBRC 101858]|uniref:hypothetical protein n=1 Tax=Amycolatopsis sp. NBRC 101858 TaxID=3032200 RepID=UPI0024A4F2CE|nr:hypothetical protein [Amycolatopsis sp. NBRC 101858]GLY41230.1 hypothetical protein Amsp01_072530 [Amycolatopsis sp. NBRC 101858]